MEALFKVVYDFLKFLEKLTGFTYEEINIIIWYIVIPFTWVLLLDKILGKHYLKATFLLILALFLIYIPDFELFALWLFNVSVDFLNLFNHLGSSYKISSVIVCVLIPMVMYFILIRKAYFRTK
ncbi:hypothetical protein SAMN04488508_10468 [Aquimarina spongiae]|uniref:Uncharacterized protein n=1 Tax=Aquimarina spongiae TaxID=570521 RepID=A0A1M6F3A0_9FLAO|nr:hypothetical protein SAMN04488508_10468 [Aquimarina spongiae]